MSRNKKLLIAVAYVLAIVLVFILTPKVIDFLEQDLKESERVAIDTMIAWHYPDYEYKFAGTVEMEKDEYLNSEHVFNPETLSKKHPFSNPRVKEYRFFGFYPISSEGEVLYNNKVVLPLYRCPDNGDWHPAL